MTKDKNEVVSTLTTEEWFAKLSASEQKQVAFEDQSLSSGLKTEGEGKLAIGKALAELQNILEPQGCFLAYLKYRNRLSHRKFSQRTAYRYITGWKHAHATIPEVALSQALANGMEIIGSSEERPFGAYTEAIQAVPPPKKVTDKSATAWLKTIEDIRAAKKPQIPVEKPPVNEEVLMHEAFILITRRLNRLPLEAQAKWIIELSGILMRAAQVVKAQMIKPVPIPKGWEVVRGRPKKVA
jgi:hypothetical protein